MSKEMEAELIAAKRLLLAILVKRGEAVAEKAFDKLISWARDNGFFASPPTLFMWEQWQSLGDLMWDLHIQGKGKQTAGLESTWKTVITVLKDMKAESKVAAAAVQMLASDGGPSADLPAALTPQRGKSLKALLGLQDHGIAIKGMSGKEHRSVNDFLSDCSAAASQAAGIALPPCSSSDAGGPLVPGGGAPVPSGSEAPAGGAQLPSAQAPAEEAAGGAQLPTAQAPAEGAAGAEGGAASAPAAAASAPAAAASAPAASAPVFTSAPAPSPGLLAQPAAAAGGNAERELTPLAQQMRALLDQMAETNRQTIQALRNRERGFNLSPERVPLPDEGQGLDSPSPSSLGFPKPEVLAPSGDGTPRPEKWLGCVQDAALNGDWDTVTSVLCPVIVGNNGPQYEQHDWKVMQQARKALREGGINTDSGRSILDWIFTADTNSPHDCKNIARNFLTPSQVISWHKEWKRLAQLEAARPRGPNDPLAGVTTDMLIGEGQFENPQIQLQFPIILHHTAARLARQAFFAVPDRAPMPMLSSIKQGITEPYPHFIDRLSQSLMAQNDLTPENKEYLLKLFAFENANSKTRPLLATLPKTAEVSEMLEVASRANQQQQSQAMAGAFAAAMEPTQRLLAAVAQKITGKKKEKTQKKTGQTNLVCYRCGNKGHHRKDCSAVVWCDHCQKDNHATCICRHAKNAKSSAQDHRAKTQVAGPMLSSNYHPPQQGEVWDSIWKQQ